MFGSHIDERSEPSVGRWMENFVLSIMPVIWLFVGIYIYIRYIYIICLAFITLKVPKKIRTRLCLSWEKNPWIL